MLKAIKLFLVFVFLLSACTPNNINSSFLNNTAEQSPSLMPTDPAAQLPTLIPTNSTHQTPTHSQTETPPKILPTATQLSPQTQTPAPVRFNLKNYRNFALIKNEFSGVSDYTGDKDWSVISTSFSLDGNAFAIAACWGSIWNSGGCEERNSGFLIVIDANTGALISDIPLGDFWPGSNAFTPDGRKLLYSTDEHKILLWDLTTNSLSRTFLSQVAKGNALHPPVAISPNGKSLAAYVNNVLYVWDLSGNLLFQTPVYQNKYRVGLTYNADGSLLALSPNDQKNIDIISIGDGTILYQYPLELAGGISFSPDGQFLAGFHYDTDIVEVWNVSNGKKVTEINSGMDLVSMQFSPESDMLLLSGIFQSESIENIYKIAALYETQNWSHIDDLYSYDLDENKIRFSQDGRKMAVISGSYIALYGEPDPKLLEGFEQLKKFQNALSQGDYEQAALLFTEEESMKDWLVEIGVDFNNLSGSFELLCETKTIFCYPVKDLVYMGNEWGQMNYLVRLEDPAGGTFTSPNGTQVLSLSMISGEENKPLLISLASDY